jgi:hypothetical protein
MNNIININNCSSCGENHTELDIFLVGDRELGILSEYHWYTKCPKTNEIIFIKEEE